MTKQEKVAKYISMLITNSPGTQKDFANKAEISASQLNRYLNGHSEMQLGSFILLLEALGIDLVEILKLKTKKASSLDDLDLKTPEDCLIHLFRGLDQVGQQTQLNQLVWANEVSKKPVPAQVKIILKETNTLV